VPRPLASSPFRLSAVECRRPVEHYVKGHGGGVLGKRLDIPL